MNAARNLTDWPNLTVRSAVPTLISCRLPAQDLWDDRPTGRAALSALGNNSLPTTWAKRPTTGLPLTIPEEQDWRFAEKRL